LAVGGRERTIFRMFAFVVEALYLLSSSNSTAFT